MTRNNKRTELIEREKETTTEETRKLKRENQIKSIMKDMSFITKTIQVGNKRIVVGEREFDMKTQVMQTLMEATLDRLGGSARVIFAMNKGLIHVLNLINQAPEGKISTRELLRSINSTSMHKHLQEAEQLGF